MENLKAKAWEEFLVKEELDAGFDSRPLEDEEQTQLYRTAIDLPHLGRVFLYVILDVTIYSTLRLIVAEHKVTPENEGAVQAFLNGQNSDTALLKFYTENGSIVIDASYVSATDKFDPTLLLVMSKQLLDYMNEVDEKIADLVK